MSERISGVIGLGILSITTWYLWREIQSSEAIGNGRTEGRSARAEEYADELRQAWESHHTRA